MPYLVEAEVRYEQLGALEYWNIYYPSDFFTRFPYLNYRTLIGKFIATCVDGKKIRIDKEFKCYISPNRYGTILEPNPLKALGLPLPLPFLIVLNKYEYEEEGKKILMPIAEGILLKSGSFRFFEDEVERILKEEEASLIVEGMDFHPQLEKCVSLLRDAHVFFKQESYAPAKTSCRKVLEDIRKIIGKWKTVDKSESLCDKLKSIVNSLYSFASIGGPHDGVVTREETDFILKTVTALLFYTNSILKNQRFEEPTSKVEAEKA